MQGDEHPLFHDPSFVLNGLESLIDKSLVQQHEHSAGTVRFRMLETIREYAFEQLAQHETASVVQHHHAAYYVALAEEISNHRSDWIDRLALEYDNLRAALTCCQMATSSGEGAAAVESGMRLCGALTYFWFKRGLWSEGRMWLGWALERTARVRPTHAQAHALAGMGEFAWHQSDFAAGYTLLNKSLALFRDLGDSKGYGRTQHSLGLVYREQGDVEHAAALLTESLALFREVGDQEGQAGALCSLGGVAILKGDAAQADVLLADSLARFRGQNVQMGVAWVTNHLGHLALLQADYDRAGTLQRESLAYFRAHDEQLGQAWALHGLGAAVLAQGHAAQAAAHFAESLTIFQQLADKHGVAWCLEGLAGTAWLGEQPERAARLWGAEAALRHALGTRSAPAMSRLSEHLQAAARARLGSEAFAGIWQQGAALSLDQAITEALEQASAFARPVSAAQPHGEGNNLPVELTSFVGRDEQIAGVCRALDGARLVTLAGAGGSGKTRLALRVAETLAASYRDGVWLVELAALNDPAFVPQAVAAALGVREATGQPLQEVLARTLAAKQLLLLLDNCEHLLDACRLLVEQLLRACPKLTVLTTSREVFQIAGEHMWPVPGLAVPAAELVAPAELMSHDSVRLFVERASASNPTFALNASNAPAVAQLCRRLDGIPLALELAAARVRHLTVQEIAARLDDRFALLTAGDPTAVPRQRTLRAAIDWSCDLLLADEQALFRRLAVFAGGWTLESAEAVCAVEHGDQQVATLELLSQLVDKSLVIVEQQGSTARYRMLETIRAYGHERLAEADELTMVRERHLDYFVHLAEQAEQQLFAAEQADWLNLLTVEHDNLRAAISNAIERANAPAALRLVTALRSFWYTRGHYQEGRQHILRALALPSAQLPTPARASALNAAGAMLWATGAAAEAGQLLDEALMIGQAVGDRLTTGWALLHQGMIAYQQNDYAAAHPLLEAGLADCRAAGAAGQRGVGWGLIFLGDLALYAGDVQQARQHFEESAALLRALADAGLLAYALRRLGHLALQHGRIERAMAYCTESLQLNLAIDDRLAVAACLAALAAVAVAQAQRIGDVAQTERIQYAARLCGAVTAQLASIGAPLWPADADMLKATIAVASAHLGEGAFAAAAAEGGAMTVEQLLGEAEAAPEQAAEPRGGAHCR